MHCSLGNKSETLSQKKGGEVTSVRRKVLGSKHFSDRGHSPLKSLEQDCFWWIAGKARRSLWLEENKEWERGRR